MAKFSTPEQDVRAFAAEFDTAAVRRMVWLAETAQITWADAAEVARRALGVALEEVRA